MAELYRKCCNAEIENVHNSYYDVVNTAKCYFTIKNWLIYLMFFFECQRVWHCFCLSVWVSGTLALGVSECLALWHWECLSVWHSGIGSVWVSGTLALKQQNIYFLFTMILRTKLPKTDPKIYPKIDPNIDPKTSITLAMFECKRQKHWECWNVKHSSIGV